MTPWAHLPNAMFIDEVLSSVRTNPKKWRAAWDAAREATRDEAWEAARGAAWHATRDALRSMARDAADDVIAALIAYDDAGQFMKLPAEQLKAMHRLDPHPMYLLLQPAAAIFAEV